MLIAIKNQLFVFQLIEIIEIQNAGKSCTTWHARIPEEITVGGNSINITMLFKCLIDM